MDQFAYQNVLHEEGRFSVDPRTGKEFHQNRKRVRKDAFIGKELAHMQGIWFLFHLVQFEHKYEHYINII